MKQQMLANQIDIKYPVTWNTLGEYMNTLQQKGISCNIASLRWRWHYSSICDR